MESSEILLNKIRTCVKKIKQINDDINYLQIAIDNCRVLQSKFGNYKNSLVKISSLVGGLTVNKCSIFSNSTNSIINDNVEPSINKVETVIDSINSLIVNLKNERADLQDSLRKAKTAHDMLMKTINDQKGT